MERVRGAVEDYRPGIVLFRNDPDAVAASGQLFTLDLERPRCLDARRAIGSRRPSVSPRHDAREGRAPAEDRPSVANANLSSTEGLRHCTPRTPPPRLRIRRAGRDDREKKEPE